MLFETEIGHIVTDSNQVILDVDDAYVEIVKRERKTLIGQKALSFTYHEDIIRNESLLNLLPTSGPAFAITKRYVCGDNSLVWVENHVSRIKAGLGSIQLYATCKPTKRSMSVDQIANKYSAICKVCQALIMGKGIFSTDIFHNPAAEILVWLYRAEMECRIATVELIAGHVGLSVRSTQRWIALLQERKFLDVENGNDALPVSVLRISRSAECALDELFTSFL